MLSRVKFDTEVFISGDLCVLAFMEPSVANDTHEASLDWVHPDDRTLVRDVLCVLQTIQQPNRLLKEWHVRLLTTPTQTMGYEISTTVDSSKSGEWEIQFSDLEILKQLDFARVGPISIRGVGPCTHLVVNITAKSVPVMVTEIELQRLRVKKRSRWFG